VASGFIVPGTTIAGDFHWPDLSASVWAEILNESRLALQAMIKIMLFMVTRVLWFFRNLDWQEFSNQFNGSV
jgi:hypothetical protein